MAKDFCITFYPGEFMQDVNSMTNEAIGVYSKILCEQIRNTCITYDDFEYFTCDLSEREKSMIRRKMVEVPGGLAIEWVKDSADKKAAYSESRSKNRAGKTKDSPPPVTTKNKEHTKTYVSHMVNVNEKEKENKVVSSDLSNSNAEKKSAPPADEIDLGDDEDFPIGVPGAALSATGFHPGPEHVTALELPEVKAGSAQQLYRIRNKKDLSHDEVMTLWGVFKVQNFTGNQFYRDENAIHSHFINWLPFQRIEDGKKDNTTGDNSDRAEKRRSGDRGAFTSKNGGFNILKRNLRNQLAASAVINGDGNPEPQPEI